MDWLELIRHASDSVVRAVMGMVPRFEVRRSQLAEKNLLDKTRGQRELVIARPQHLQDRYAVVNDGRVIDDAFTSLKEKLFGDCEALSAAARRGDGGKTIYRETGKTSEGRAFAFFKPFNDYGWLMERSGAGWRISRAEKIVTQQMFLRSNNDPWDVAVLHADPERRGIVRVSSQRFGQTLMSLAVYEQRMRDAFRVELIGRDA